MLPFAADLDGENADFGGDEGGKGRGRSAWKGPGLPLRGKECRSLPSFKAFFFEEGKRGTLPPEEQEEKRP